MGDNPIRVSKFKQKQHEFRDTNVCSMLGPKIVSPNRWESVAKRIKEEENNNKVLFLEAFNDKNKVL